MGDHVPLESRNHRPVLPRPASGADARRAYRRHEEPHESDRSPGLASAHAQELDAGTIREPVAFGRKSDGFFDVVHHPRHQERQRTVKFMDVLQLS